MQTQASCQANLPCMRCTCLKQHGASHLQTVSQRLVRRTASNADHTDPDFAMQPSNTLNGSVLLQMRPVNFSARKRARFATRKTVHQHYVHKLGGHRIDDRLAGPKMGPQIGRTHGRAGARAGGPTGPDQTGPYKTRPDKTNPNQSRSDQNRTEQSRAEESSAEHNRVGQDTAKQSRAEPSRAE